MRILKGYLIHTGMVLASVFVGLLLLEVILRPIYGVAKPYGFQTEDNSEEIRYGVYDTRGFWTWRPNFRGSFDNGIDFSRNRITTNSDGSRTVPCHKVHTRSLPRIFLLGDSQTFGWGLSDHDTWANQLQCELEKKRPGAYSIINLGFPGAQVDQLYARGIGQVEPVVSEGDIVVISFTWNDLITYYVGEQFAHQVLKDAGLRAVQRSDAFQAYEQLSNNEFSSKADSVGGRELTIKLSSPIRYLGKKSWRHPIYKEYGVFIPSFDSVKSFFNSLQHVSTVFRIVWSSARLLYYRLRPKDALEKKIPRHTFSSNFFVLKALQTRLRKKGARVFIQLLPSRLFFDDYYYGFYSRGKQAFPSQDYMGVVSKPFCNSLHLKCLNRFDALTTASRDEHTFPIDGHYNPAGAAKIARALALELLR